MAEETAVKNSGKSVRGRKKLTFFLTVAVNLAIVAYIAIREFGSGGGGGQGAAVKDVNMLYLLFAVACLLLAILMETWKYQSMMMAAEGRADLRGAFECAVLGKYYDNVTPLGAGGQPFQMFYLKKLGLSNGASAALPIAGFLSLQVAFILIAVVVFIFNGSVTERVAAIRISAYVGLAFYCFLPLCIVLFAAIPNVFEKIICVVVRGLHKLRLVKDYENRAGKISTSLREYCRSLGLLCSRPLLLVKLLLFSLIYQLAILSVPFFVLRAFGGGADWWTVFSLVVFIYAAITIIPTPGNAGAAEGSFYVVFSSLASGFLFWAMVIWRVLVYYSWLGMGLILMFLMRGPTRERRERPISPQHPLRVAQFVDIFFPNIDGVVRTVDAYAGRMNRAGGHCCVICPRPLEPFEDDLDYQVVRTPGLKLPGIACRIPMPFFSRKTRKYLRQNQFDLFHAHSPFFEGRFAVMMGRKLGIPVVATFHSKYYDDVLSLTHSKVLARLITDYIVSFYCKVDEVWACSAGTADTLRSYGFKGEIRVMDNGVDIMELPDAQALRSRAVQELGLPTDRRILLFVGQLIWQKNLRLILDVTKRLRETDERFVAVIAGQGYDGEAIRDYAGQLKLGDGVLFTGQITDRELLQGLFLSGDLFLFPSVYDNSPLVVREAALMGLPALLAEGSNAAEVVTDGVNGFTAPETCQAMTEKVLDIFSSADLAAVGGKARETIPVSWDEIVVRAQAQYCTVHKHRHMLRQEPEKLPDPG